MAVVHLYGPKPRLSIYNVVKWSLRVNWVQYEPNLKIPILGICTYANTPILVVLGLFWPHGPNFDQISQIHSVTSYLGPKHCISRSKMVQFGNFKFSILPRSEANGVLIGCVPHLGQTGGQPAALRLQAKTISYIIFFKTDSFQIVQCALLYHMLYIFLGSANL